MTKTFSELAQRWFARRPDSLTETESEVLKSALDRRTISRDVNDVHETTLSRGERLADAIARIGGSWSFINTFLLFLLIWTGLNAWMLGRNAFDPYPFIFLNLVLSMIAALQAPIIMMSQNRQAQRDRVDAAHDYAVNLKAEIEIMALHEKFDEIRHRDIMALREEIGELRKVLLSLQATVSRPADNPG